MIIKMTLNDLRNSLKSLNVISQKEGLDFKFNYRIARISKDIEPLVKVYEETLRKFLIENGERNKDTGDFKLNVSDECIIEKFKTTNEELLNEEHEIDIDKIPIKMFEDYDITAGDIKNLFWLIEGEI